MADAEMTGRLLAEAYALAAMESRSPPLPADTGLSGYLVRCWEARCWAVLEPTKGVMLYEDVLRNWPHAVGRRDRGLYAASGDLDRARAEGRKAFTIARAMNSVTAARELRQLHDVLRA
jgi:hypothetical protein